VRRGRGCLPPAPGQTVKRAFDIVASLAGLIVLAVPLLVIAALVKSDSPGPVFFRQVRVGRLGTHFRIWKFRTMRVESEQDGKLTLGDDARITRVGRALRRFKLDELPQLINVLVGEMSLVGPRPEVPEYAHLLPEQERVWSVRPGITDPTAIRFRNESALLGAAPDPDVFYREVLLPQKTAAYLEYIDTATFARDLRVLFATVGAVITRPGGER